MMPRKKHLAFTAVAAAFAAFGANAQTLVTPPEGGETIVVPPEGADTILIVTPADTTATVQAAQATPTRDEVRAQAREATQSGLIPRGEHDWADRSSHRQSSQSPYDAADSGRPRY